jgi:hypothetical protein
MAGGRAVDHAEERADRQLEAELKPRAQLLEAPGVHPDLAPAPALARAHEQRAALRVEIALVERERLLDPQPGAPEHRDQRAQARAMAILAGGAHHRDDLLDARRVGRVVLALVARRAACVVAGQGRRRAAAAGDVEQLRRR